MWIGYVLGVSVTFAKIPTHSIECNPRFAIQYCFTCASYENCILNPDEIGNWGLMHRVVCPNIFCIACGHVCVARHLTNDIITLADENDCFCIMRKDTRT